MANENFDRDGNHVPVAGAVTDNVAEETRMWRIDDTTKGIKVTFVGGSFIDGSGTANQVAYFTDTNTLSSLSNGTAGWVLTSNGAGSAPSFQTSAGANLVVGTTTITSGTDTRILYDNAGVVGEYIAASTATTSSVTMRDANANIFANNYISNTTSTVSAGGTTVLTVGSSRLQILTGASSQTYQLPNATTLAISAWFTFNNNSSGSLIITNNGGSTLYTVPAGGAVDCFVTNISTSNGVWDFHALTPAITTWSSGVSGLIMNTALTTSPQILSGASSSTAPSFIPQRGASTTGYGGDGTNLYTTIGGTAIGTWSSSGLGLGTNSLTLTGSIASTGSRVTKGWFTDIESTNAPTVGGTALPTATSTTTFTNKAITQRVVTTTDDATAVIDVAVTDVYELSAIANNTTFSFTGSPTDGQKFIIRYKDAGVSKTLTWTGFVAIGITLPTATTANKWGYVGVQYNAAAAAYHALATVTEA